MIRDPIWDIERRSSESCLAVALTPYMLASYNSIAFGKVNSRICGVAFSFVKSDEYLSFEACILPPRSYES